MTRPVLLLDIDGVLNPLAPADLTLFDPLEDVVGLHPLARNVHFSKDNIVRLSLLADKFDLAWATAWEDTANLHVGPAHELPKLAHVSFHNVEINLGEIDREVALIFLGGDTCWKLPFIVRWLGLNGNPPVAWIDDQIGMGDREWANWRTVTQGFPTFLVKTEPTLGMTDENARHLLQWANDLAAKLAVEGV